MYKDNMTLEEREVYDMIQHARKKNQRFKKECEIIDKIKASDEYLVVLEEYDCIVAVRDRDYKLMHNANVVQRFTYLDDLAEYVVANY